LRAVPQAVNNLAPIGDPAFAEEPVQPLRRGLRPALEKLACDLRWQIFERASTGESAAPPSSVMNSRRFS
jgi:hypothetical protein